MTHVTQFDNISNILIILGQYIYWHITIYILINHVLIRYVWYHYSTQFSGDYGITVLALCKINFLIIISSRKYCFDYHTTFITCMRSESLSWCESIFLNISANDISQFVLLIPYRSTMNYTVLFTAYVV